MISLQKLIASTETSLLSISKPESSNDKEKTRSIHQEETNHWIERHNIGKKKMQFLIDKRVSFGPYRTILKVQEDMEE